MDIHVVQPGDTLYKIACDYGIPLARLEEDNQLPDPNRLVVGQSLVIRYPKRTWVVCAGDTLSGIAERADMTVRQLLRNNPSLNSTTVLVPGQTLVLEYRDDPEESIDIGGFAYPGIEPALLQSTLPYLTDLSVFTYGFTEDGQLIPPESNTLSQQAAAMGTEPWFTLSTLRGTSGFSNQLAHRLFTDQQVQNRLLQEVIQEAAVGGYQGVDVDFEFIYPKDADAFAAFIMRLKEMLSPLDKDVSVALAPKTFASQHGIIYEGHNYRKLGQAADRALLMTYEWGYTYGPPMAVAPIRSVRQVIEYALQEIPAEKIRMGIPNYGYDWTLPYQRGRAAKSISNQEALELAFRHYAAIRYDQEAQSPWFRYVDDLGQEHVVWFEDARSIRAKLALVQEYGLAGASYWNLMRPFPQNWAVLNAMYEIEEEEQD